MTEVHHIRIDLHRTSSGGPSGRVRTAAGDRAFDGWLGLIAVLSGVLGRSAETADDLGGETDP